MQMIFSTAAGIARVIGLSFIVFLPVILGIAFFILRSALAG